MAGGNARPRSLHGPIFGRTRRLSFQARAFATWRWLKATRALAVLLPFALNWGGRVRPAKKVLNVDVAVLAVADIGREVLQRSE